MQTRVERPVVTLDPSSTYCGWAIFRRLELVAHGTVKRGRRALTDFALQCAREIRAAVGGDGFKADFDVWYEINDRQDIHRKKQMSMRLQAQGAGRILQALGVEGEEEQVDSKTKEQRAWEASLIYGVKDCPANEHALDAIALGHAIITKPQTLARLHR